MNFKGNSPHSDLGLIPASAEQTDVLAPHSRVQLAPAEFERLRRIPPLLEWLANLENPNTRRAYRNDLLDFMQFVGLQDPQALPTVTRAHVIAWRRSMTARALKPASVRCKLSALSEFYHFLADLNLIATNPVDGVKRPAEGAKEEKPPRSRTPKPKRSSLDE